MALCISTMGKFEDKKPEELFYLARLRELGFKFPALEVIPSEAPDFLMPTPDHQTIGLEVRRLYHPFDLASDSGGPRQEQDSLRGRTVALAKEIHDRSGGGPVFAWFGWRRDARLTKRRIEPLAHELADLVGEARVTRNEGSRVLEPRPFQTPRLPAEVDQVDISYLGYFPGRWSMAEAICVPVADAAYLRREISSKERLLDSYRQRVDSAWLILGIGGYPPSQDLRVAPDVRTEVFSTGFDRILVVDHFRDEFVDLRLEPRLFDKHCLTGDPIRES